MAGSAHRLTWWLYNNSPTTLPWETRWRNLILACFATASDIWADDLHIDCLTA